MRRAGGAQSRRHQKPHDNRQPDDTNPHLVSLATWRHTIPMKTLAPSYLKHQFLIAMPHMADPNFAQTLTYIVEHNEHGAMGLVVNRPQELSLADILEQLRPDETPPASTLQVPIYQGGPVQTDRGFVLHSSECSFQASVALEGLSLTTSQDILLAIAAGVGPKQSLITLG